MRNPPLVAPSLGDSPHHAERNGEIAERLFGLAWKALLVGALALAVGAVA